MEMDRMPSRAGRKRKSPKETRQADFYTKVLDEAERLDFELASGVNGIDDEIALLRVKIKSILEHDPENVKLIMQATNALERLIRTRYKITREQRKGLKEAIGNVLGEVALPLGIGIGTSLGK
jgi:dsDNA-binding SOS-regulon protein